MFMMFFLFLVIQLVPNTNCPTAPSASVNLVDMPNARHSNVRSARRDCGPFHQRRVHAAVSHAPKAR